MPTSTRSSAPRRRTSPTSSARACASSSPDLPGDHPVRRYARGEDGAARPPRPRVLEGRRRPPRAAVAARLGGAPERGAGRRAAPARDEPRRLVGPRDRRHAGDRPRDRAPARRATARRAVASATCATTRAAEAAADGAPRGRRRAGARARQRRSKPRVVEELAAHGPYRVVVHNAATGVIRPALETEDKHWDWTLNANARALLALARAAAPQMPDGLVDRRDLEPRLAARARELRARRDVEGGARVASSATSPSSSRRAGSA